MSPTFNYAIGLLMLLCARAFAAPTEVEIFDKSTWPALLSDKRQPAMIVFSSVSCTHCPATIERLAARRSASQSATRLYVVLMDSEDDTAALGNPHHRLVDRVFAFQGRTQSLQFMVSPDWRGMTPFIAYADGKGGVRFVMGDPDERTLTSWLKTKK